MQKRAVNGYFNFTRKEKNGTIVLLSIILLITAVPLIYPLISSKKQINANDLQTELAVLKTQEQDNSKKDYSKNYDKERPDNFYRPSEKRSYTNTVKGDLFYFDPNTLPADGWQKLGLREKTIHTIRNFINKGGKFRKPEDIKKIWGLHEDELQRLLPFVKIEAGQRVSTFPAANVTYAKYESKKVFGKVDINIADTVALIKLPGIGSKLSNRIISFREKLGGFYNIQQVAETFGLQDSVFQAIKPLLQLHDINLKRININTALMDELKQHPYIRYNLANLIIQYRTQHGNFSTVSDLKKIMAVDDALYNKLSPYLITQ